MTIKNGQNVTYSCVNVDQGIASGDEEIQCVNGQWSSNEIPQCKPINGICFRNYNSFLNDRTSKLSSCRKANVKPIRTWVIDFFSLFLRPASRTRVLPILRPAGRTEYRRFATFWRRLYDYFWNKSRRHVILFKSSQKSLKTSQSKRKVTEKWSVQITSTFPRYDDTKHTLLARRIA